MIQTLEVSQIWFWTGSTVRFENTVRVSGQPLGEVRFACHTLPLNNEELVAGLNYVVLLVEVLHNLVTLERLECAVDGQPDVSKPSCKSQLFDLLL